MSQERRNILALSVGVALAYTIAFLAVRYLVYPLQNMFLPGVSTYASLFFLPHGIRVIATWLYREKAIIPLLIAHFCMYSLFYAHGEDPAQNLVAMFSGSICCYLALQFFSFSKIDLSLNNLDISHWRSLIFLGFIASVFNTAGNMLAFSDGVTSDLHLNIVSAYVLGDTLGTAACLVILMFLNRLLRAYRAARATS